MKNIGILILITGLAFISACASNEASMNTDDSSAKAADEQPAAASEDMKAEEPMMQTEAPAEEVEMVEVTEVDVVATDTGDTGDTGELVSTCTHDDQVRIITVVFDDEATGKACEVKYEKSTGVQTLWSAILDKDYCREKAAEFVKKQEGWGWVCSELE